MMLKKEKQTSHAIAFEVDIGTHGSLGKASPPPEIKKKLEATAKAAQGPQITLEQIAEKLHRAEQKRKQSLINQVSPKIEERRRNIRDKKKSIDRTTTEQLLTKIERSLSHAKEKRSTTMEEKQQKLRNHIQKVDEVRKEQAVKRKESTEMLKQEIV